MGHHRVGLSFLEFLLLSLSSYPDLMLKKKKKKEEPMYELLIGEQIAYLMLNDGFI